MTKDLTIRKNQHEDHGVDELNLAEFPLAVLSQRPQGNKVVYKNMVTDNYSKQRVERSLTISATEGETLPAPYDSNVILGLLQFSDRIDEDGYQEFSLREIANILGLPTSGQSLQRIKLSINKWFAINLEYKNAWFDARNKEWKDVKFHIIDSVINGKDGFKIRWGMEFMNSIKANYLKPLDLQIFRNLKNPLAQVLFRFLDKKFWRQSSCDYELENLAFNHLGLPKNLTISEVKRRMKPALEALEMLNIIERDQDRYYKRRKEWRIVFHKIASKSTKPGQIDMFNGEKEESDLQKRLVGIGVSKDQSERLFEKYEEERIERNLEHVLFLRATGHKITKIVPYFLKVVEDNPELPAGFVPEVDRVQKEIKRTEEKAVLYEKESQERDKVEKEWTKTQKVVDDYLDALTDSQRNKFIAGIKLNGISDQEGGPFWYMAIEEAIQNLKK